MPHDAKGALLTVGDKVIVLGTITQISEGEDYCNCTVEAEHGFPPSMIKQQFAYLNTKQVEKQ